MRDTKVLLVIDGQGGKIGKLLIERIKTEITDAEIIAVGTNSIATSNMIKGGAENAATGENPVIAASRYVDIIVGPIGIVVADALLGEITPAIALAVGQSRAKKILIPINRCDNLIVGTKELTVGEMVEQAILLIRENLK